MITWVLDKFFAMGQMRRRLKVQMHEAMYMPHSDDPFYSPPVTGFTPSASGVVGADHYFLTMTNLSPKRDLVITHIWLKTTPQHHVLDPQLPKRLAPDESWATGIPIARSAADEAALLVRPSTAE